MSLGLWMTWKTLRRELRALDTINNLRLWLTSITLSRELKALDAIHNSWLLMICLWVMSLSLICHEQLKVVYHMHDFWLWAQASRCYSSSRLWMIWMILGCELMVIDVMNSLGVWMLGMTSGHELKTLDVMNSLRLWLTWTTFNCELKILDAMNSSGL